MVHVVNVEDTQFIGAKAGASDKIRAWSGATFLNSKDNGTVKTSTDIGSSFTIQLVSADYWQVVGSVGDINIETS